MLFCNKNIGLIKGYWRIISPNDFLCFKLENHLYLSMKHSTKAQMIIIMNLLISLYAGIYNQCFFISGLLHSEKSASEREYQKLYKQTGALLIMELFRGIY